MERYVIMLWRGFIEPDRFSMKRSCLVTLPPAIFAASVITFLHRTTVQKLSVCRLNHKVYLGGIWRRAHANQALQPRGSRQHIQEMVGRGSVVLHAQHTPLGLAIEEFGQEGAASARPNFQNRSASSGIRGASAMTSRWLAESLMGIVAFALRSRHTFYVLAFLGGSAIVTAPKDISRTSIFPSSR